MFQKNKITWLGDAGLPEAMLTIFKKTGVPIEDPQTNCEFRELDLLAAVDHVFE